MDKLLIVHFGELSTKGDNRSSFIDCLFSNIKRRLSSFEGIAVTKSREHIYISLSEGSAEEEILSVLAEIPGIQRISVAYRQARDIEAIKETCLCILLEEKPVSWKASVKRADKTFPLDSYGVAREVGGHCLKNGAPGVDVHNPGMTLEIEIRPGFSLVAYKDVQGAGGYPLGMNGKVLVMLSGGIDSPVACQKLLRRGLLIECLHFASPPYTSLAVLDKLRDILQILTQYQAKIRLHVVPFTKIQEAIYRNVPEPYCITIMRRMMFRLADMAAKKYGICAIATGESIGQVASQTLESMKTINDVTNMPILRPLAVTDKLSIIEDAKKLGTYEISIRPYEDCCTIFAPKRPKTKPRIDEAENYESRFEWQSLLEEAINNIESESITAKEGD